MAYTTLRSLALTVQEDRPGEFHWVVLERLDDQAEFEVLIGAEDKCRTYGEALSNGTAMLNALADGNMKIGPRTHLEDLPLFVETARPGLYDLVDD